MCLSVKEDDSCGWENRPKRDSTRRNAHFVIVLLRLPAFRQLRHSHFYLIIPLEHSIGSVASAFLGLQNCLKDWRSTNRPNSPPANPAVNSTTVMPSPSHATYIQKCIELAKQAPSLPTNFRVGAVLLSRKDNDSEHSDDCILSTGYTMELAGNTHAEQCCFANFAAVHKVEEEKVADMLPVEAGRKLIMYASMEPCGKRLSGNAPCAQRIARTRDGGREGIHKVYFGVKEPETFVGESEGCRMLTEAGIGWEHVSGMEREILSVATAGHENSAEEVNAALGEKNSSIDDISAEKQRQDQIPRNPKKRMMEGENMIY